MRLWLSTLTGEVDSMRSAGSRRCAVLRIDAECGLLFHALLSLLFELPSVANRDECSSSEPGGPKPSIEIIGSYNGRGAAVGRGLGVGVSLGVGLGEGTANAYTLLSPAT